MDTLKRLQAARASLVLNSPFFATLALRLKFREDQEGLLEEHPIGTNGVDIRYNPAALEKFNHSELTGLIAHEASHPALKHHLRREGRDSELWNYACDYAINPALIAAGFTLPDGSLNRADFDGKSAETIYGILQEETRERENNGQDPDPDQSGGPGPVGMVMDWPGPNGGDGAAPDMPGDPPAPDRDPTHPPTPAEIAEESGRWDTATASAMLQAAGAGKLPGSLQSLALDSIRPRVPWRDILAPFIQQTQDDYSWFPPDRRFVSAGLFLPSLSGEGIKKITLAVDTSGSMPPALVSEIMGEAAEILEFWPGATLEVIYHHSAVYRVETYESGNPPELGEYESGGTDFRPVFEHIDREGLRPDCVVMLTDLEGPCPETAPDYPVLWVSYGRDAAPFGEVVKIN